MIKEKGIVLAEVKRDKTGVYDGYIKLTVTTDTMTRSIAGTVFSDGKPRFIQIKGINLDADVGSHMVYIANTDVPGMIGFIARRSVRPMSTLPTSSSAATSRAAMPSRCYTSTARSTMRFWPS